MYTIGLIFAWLIVSFCVAIAVGSVIRGGREVGYDDEEQLAYLAEYQREKNRS